jgi:crossover junction endodeoxyribonuclease RusA
VGIVRSVMVGNRSDRMIDVDEKAVGWLIRAYGIPAPQGSKRHVGNGVMVEMSKKLKPWRAAVVEAVQHGGFGPVMDMPLCVHAIFILLRPKYHFNARGELRDNAPVVVSKFPDCDKLLRSTMDALKQSGIIKDDALAWDQRGRKVYAHPGEQPGAIIHLWADDGTR